MPYSNNNINNSNSQFFTKPKISSLTPELIEEIQANQENEKKELEKKNAKESGPIETLIKDIESIKLYQNQEIDEFIQKFLRQPKLINPFFNKINREGMSTNIKYFISALARTIIFSGDRDNHRRFSAVKNDHLHLAFYNAFLILNKKDLAEVHLIKGIKDEKLRTELNNYKRPSNKI